MMKCGNKDTNQASNQYTQRNKNSFFLKEMELYDFKKLVGSLISGRY